MEAASRRQRAGRSFIPGEILGFVSMLGTV
jgi:hypothetical protein